MLATRQLAIILAFEEMATVLEKGSRLNFSILASEFEVFHVSLFSRIGKLI